MNDTKTTRMLARYKAWADDRILAATAALPPGEAAKQRQTLFKTMIGTLNHNYVVDLIWQSHLQGRPHGFTARNMVLHAEIEALREAQARLNGWYVEWADAQTPDTLAERLSFKFISGKPGVMSRGDMLLHVVTHTAYHRGWVAEMFFEVPAKAPDTDLPVYLTAL
jgi:uncharacterized damage-inducible protein DinB